MKTKTEKQSNPKEIVFFIDKQQYKTPETALSVRALLEIAEEDAAETSLVLQHGHDLKKFTNLDEMVPLENGMHFVVYHNSPTPVS